MLFSAISIISIVTSAVSGSAPHQGSAEGIQQFPGDAAEAGIMVAGGGARNPQQAFSPFRASGLDWRGGEDMGACCYGAVADPGYEPYQCIGDMPREECLGMSAYTHWTACSSCADPTFECPVVAGPCGASGGCDEYIQRVQIGDIDNSSGCDHYADYTTISTIVVFGVDYPITVTNGVAYPADACSIWVDWNQDRIFEDAAPELIGDVVGGGITPPYSFILSVPPDAIAGCARMRIRIDYANPDPDPCGTTTYGEVEDYSLRVVMGDVYGACCNYFTGECLDAYAAADCSALGAEWQWHYQLSCGELNPPCGDPGCCCDMPEPCSSAADPHFAYRANCNGRFISGLLGADCATAAFTPGCGMWCPTGLLYAPTQPDNAAFRAAVSELLNSPVDYFDARVGTPTLGQLEPYAAVLTWVNYAYADRNAMGDVLADFVDAGGRVILGQWAYHTSPINWLAGRIMTPDYCPAICSYYATSTWTYAGDGTACPLASGPGRQVGSLSSGYTDAITGLQPGALSDGHWSAGTPVVAFWPHMNVFYSSGHTGMDYSAGDWARLTANMVLCWMPPSGACCNIHTGECVDSSPVSECLEQGPEWQWHWDGCAQLDPPCGDPGACCDIHSGECVENVLAANCTEQHHSGLLCAELYPPCGGPMGCCCDDTTGIVTPSTQAGCTGRWEPLLLACGDLDFNGVVDITDYGLFLDTFGLCAGAPGYIPGADLDGDGCVTLVDFQMWRVCYMSSGVSCTPGMFHPPCGQWSPGGLLYAPSEGDAPSFRAAVSGLLGAQVDYFDARNSTPTVDEMRSYAAILVWVNYPLFDNVEYGDNLADYVDGGGRAILGQWCFPTAGNYLAGRIMTAEYCPVATMGGWTGGTYNNDCIDCVTLLNPVEELFSSYIDVIGSVNPGAVFCGTYSSGGYALAWRADRGVYYSPGQMGMMYGGTGDWAALAANMVLCTDEPLYGACCDPYTQPVPGGPGECTEWLPYTNCAPPSEFHVYQTCAELDPPCGNPGACCDHETEICTDGVLELNCLLDREFVGGILCADFEQVTGHACDAQPWCEHRVDLYDGYGDGWNGNTLDVYVGGLLVLSSITMPSGLGPLSFSFVAGTGIEIQTVYNPIGGWPYEPYYMIYDGNGQFLVMDGGGGAQPLGVHTIGNCEPLSRAPGACVPQSPEQVRSARTAH